MTKAGERITEGMREALAIAKGEQPAASIHMNGHDYVPREEFEHHKQIATDLQSENNRLRAALEWLDRQGGLGYRAHDRIKAALAKEAGQ